MKVLWQYRDADLEFGYQQARELEDHLSNVLRNYAVDILHGGVEEGGYVEVRPKGVNKGVFAMKAICCYDKITNSKSGLLGHICCRLELLWNIRKLWIRH